MHANCFFIGVPCVSDASGRIAIGRMSTLHVITFYRQHRIHSLLTLCLIDDDDDNDHYYYYYLK